MEKQSVKLQTVLLGMLAVTLSAQAELVSRGENTGIGARAVSMGEAFTAIADDYSALYYNASGMTQLRRPELGLNLGYRMRDNNATPANGLAGQGTVETTRLNALSLILTQGEGWAFGMGYYSPTSFDDPLRYYARGREYAYEDLGRMDHYRLAFAYAPSWRASVGLAATAMSGTEQLQIVDSNTTRFLDEYSGFNLEPSFLLHLSEDLTLGGSAVVVERLALRDTYQEYGSNSVTTDYTIRRPFQTRLGLAYQSGLTQVSVDWHATYWSGYAYAETGGAFLQSDGNLSNQHVFALGLEQYLTRKGPVLRAGISLETDDASTWDRPWIEHPKGFYLGFGLPASKYLSLDLAYQYHNDSYMQNSVAGGPADLTVAESAQQVMGSLRLRW